MKYLNAVGYMLVLILVVAVVAKPAVGAREMALGSMGGGPFLMIRPQRPAQFRHEGEVKAYLQKLRNWVEDSMRNNARFGKRDYQLPMTTKDDQDNKNIRPQHWNEYDYYNNNNRR